MITAILLLFASGVISITVEKRRNKPGLQGSSEQAQNSLAAVLVGNKSKHAKNVVVKPDEKDYFSKGETWVTGRYHKDKVISFDPTKDRFSEGKKRPGVADLKGTIQKKTGRVSMGVAARCSIPIVTESQNKLQVLRKQNSSAKAEVWQRMNKDPGPKPGIPATSHPFRSRIPSVETHVNRFNILKPALVMEPIQKSSRPAVTRSVDAALVLNKIRGRI
jgi:hypothetical protein